MVKNVEKGLENNINDILKTLRSQTEQTRVLVDVNQKLTSANKDLRHDLGISRRQAAHYKKTTNHQRERADYFRAERDDLEVVIEGLNGELFSVTQQYVDLQKDAKDLRKQGGILKRQVKHYKKTTDEQRERADHFREERDVYEAQVGDLTVQLKTSQQDIVSLTEILDIIQKDNVDLNENLVRTKESVKYLEGRTKELEQTINDKDAELVEKDSVLAISNDRINEAYTVIKQKNSRLSRTRIGLCATALCTLLFGYVAGIGSGSVANVNPTQVVQTVEQTTVEQT
ncbi:hypothetical protein COV11_00550, partial [Candidatus Woesearchaeota archaeon CG10_big_fil_rev_8_21_14_0_10_30_7]